MKNDKKINNGNKNREKQPLIKKNKKDELKDLANKDLSDNEVNDNLTNKVNEDLQIEHTLEEVSDGEITEQALELGGVIPEPEVEELLENQSLMTKSNKPVRNPGDRVGIGWTISIILTAIFGLTISIYLTMHHYRMMSGLPQFQSFCTVNEVIDCDMVNTSSYSEFKGLPLALFGAGIYAIVFSLMILSIFVKGVLLKRYMVFVSLIGLLSFGFSLYLAYVSAFILGAVCILCVITYFVNLYTFLGAAFAAFGTTWFRKPIKSFLGPFGFDFKSFIDKYSISRPKSAIGNAAGLFIIFMVLVQGFFATIYLDAKYIGFSDKDISSFLEKYKSIVPQEPNIEGAPYWGTDDPDLTIVVFEDYLCTFCKRAHITAFPVFKEYKKRIKFVFKHLPYDKDCHPNLQRTLHPGACKSAIAAACASLQGRDKFMKFQEYFFSHQEIIKPEMDIAKTAEEIGGVDMAKFDECLDLGKGDLIVRNDFIDAAELKITRTPAYFFNGRKWEGALKPIFIKKILEIELKAGADKRRKRGK